MFGKAGSPGDLGGVFLISGGVEGVEDCSGRIGGGGGGGGGGGAGMFLHSSIFSRTCSSSANFYMTASWEGSLRTSSLRPAIAKNFLNLISMSPLLSMIFTSDPFI